MPAERLIIGKPRQDRTLTRDPQEPSPARELLPAPFDLEHQVAAFIEHYNHAQCGESLDNITSADIYLKRAEGILFKREGFTQDKRQSPLAASAAGRITSSTNEPEPPFLTHTVCLKDTPC